jgi:hypothetical protein
VGKPEGRGPLGRWDDNIKIGILEIKRAGGGLRNKWWARRMVMNFQGFCNKWGVSCLTVGLLASHTKTSVKLETDAS